MVGIEPPEGHWSLGLPRKREFSGALFFDSEGRVLLVKPTYRDHWGNPGGSVEANEGPYDAATREVKEEIGLFRILGRLLAVDWEPRTQRIPIEGLGTLFDGGVLTAEEIAQIRLPPQELSAFEFCSRDRLAERLDALHVRRITAAIRARDNGTVAYLENGYPRPR